MSARDEHSELDELVAQHIALMERGHASASSRLSDQPYGLVDEVSPVFRAMERLCELDVPPMNPQAVTGLEKRLRVRTRELKVEAWARQPVGLRLSAILVRAALCTLVIACLLGVSGGGVYAASNSLPGTSLYPVKRAAERLQLSLAYDSESKAALHATFALRRLHEVVALQERQGRWASDTLAEVQMELQQVAEHATATATANGADKAHPVLEELAALAGQVEADLSAGRYSDATAHEARPILKQARARALHALGRTEDSEGPAATYIPDNLDQGGGPETPASDRKGSEPVVEQGGGQGQGEPVHTPGGRKGDGPADPKTPAPDTKATAAPTPNVASAKPTAASTPKAANIKPTVASTPKTANIKPTSAPAIGASNPGSAAPQGNPSQGVSDSSGGSGGGQSVSGGSSSGGSGGGKSSGDNKGSGGGKSSGGSKGSGGGKKSK